MRKSIIDWAIFILLSFIWGSSFILMKDGMLALSPYQVASIRIVSAGIVLLPVSIKYMKTIPLNKIGWMFLAGVIGNLLPAYLFCIAETKIDSALAGTLNSLTPVFVIVTGALLFKSKIPSSKILGIVIALTGSIFLLISKGFKEDQHMLYVLCIIIATIFYGINVNMVHKYLHSTGSLKTAAISLSTSAIPALFVLFITGYFKLPLLQKDYFISTAASAVLGIAGTAIATVLFYILIKRAGIIFSSMVTYGIPFIAIFWGFMAHENISWKQIVSLLIILAGIYIANNSKKVVAIPD
ncbi:MAG: DMT family transporter [Chitinophagaceae bacterium]|nr:DMT family transporter [Chitinophagaceae bacterium]